MKKFFLSLLLFCCFFMTGCFGDKNGDVIKDFTDRVQKVKAYHINGKLEIVNNEESYLYDVDVSYKDSDYFRVSLKNKTNDHEQIILKNDSGVYV